MAIVVGGNARVGLGERHLHQVDRRAEERPLADTSRGRRRDPRPRCRDRASRRRRATRRAAAASASRRTATGIARRVCRPPSALAPGRAAADVERVELGFRRRGAEVAQEPRIVVDGAPEAGSRGVRRPVPWWRASADRPGAAWRASLPGSPWCRPRACAARCRAGRTWPESSRPARSRAACRRPSPAAATGSPDTSGRRRGRRCRRGRERA